MTPACRECHREGEHQLSCSHVRYEGRIEVAPSDEVAADHEPSQPYCPGPEVGCYYQSIVGEYAEPLCYRTGNESCYYHHEE